MESLPIDIVLVRHGESEGNLAQSLSKKGDDSLWSTEFASRHTSNYRLTDRGREQARQASKWIKENITQTFDMYYVSEYIRAQETAALLDFVNAKWNVSFYLREQDRGILAGKSKQERANEYADLVRRWKKDSLYVAPPGGESLANVCLRVDRVIKEWQRSCSGMRIIAVCHGNIMTAFRVVLERISQSKFQEIEQSEDPKDRMYNGQIIHYTRRNPWTGEIAEIPRWVRSIVPWDLSLGRHEWQEFEHPLFSTEQILEEVAKVPQIINNGDLEKVKKLKEEENVKEEKKA